MVVRVEASAVDIIRGADRLLLMWYIQQELLL